MSGKKRRRTRQHDHGTKAAAENSGGDRTCEAAIHNAAAASQGLRSVRQLAGAVELEVASRAYRAIYLRINSGDLLKEITAGILMYPS